MEGGINSRFRETLRNHEGLSIGKKIKVMLTD